ncbi:MAG: hypothetical protein ACOWWH_07405 [Eubacteriaceae bacterium]
MSYEYINEEFETHHLGGNLLLKSCTAIATFFLSVMSDPQLNRFFAEMYHNTSGILPGDSFYKSVFRTLFKACNKDAKGKNFQLVYIYHTSCQGELLRQYLAGTLSATRIEILEYVLDHLLDDLGIDSLKRKDIIDRSFETCNHLEVKFVDIYWKELSLSET